MANVPSGSDIAVVATALGGLAGGVLAIWKGRERARERRERREAEREERDDDWFRQQVRDLLAAREQEMRRIEQRLAAMEQSLADCHAKHEECERRCAGMERENAELRERFERLAGQVEHGQMSRRVARKAAAERQDNTEEAEDSR